MQPNARNGDEATWIRARQCKYGFKYCCGFIPGCINTSIININIKENEKRWNNGISGWQPHDSNAARVAICAVHSRVLLGNHISTNELYAL